MVCICPLMAVRWQTDILRVKRKTAPLPVFMLIVALMMFVLFSAFWSLDAYLLWERVYQLLPLRQTDSSGEVDLAGIISPAYIPAYVQQILLPLIVGQ